MRHKLHKVFFIWDFEEEENWINEMSAQGHQLEGVGLVNYTFRDGNPGEYIYHLECLKKWPTHHDSMQYIRFLEDTGIEYIGSLKKWAYFRKESAAGPFELYNDLDSKIDLIKRVRMTNMAIIPVLVFCILSQIIRCFLGRMDEIDYLFSGLTTGLFLVFLGVAIAGFVRISKAYRRLKAERAIRE